MRNNRAARRSFDARRIDRVSPRKTRTINARLTRGLRTNGGDAFDRPGATETAQCHAAPTIEEIRASVAPRSVRAHDVIEERLRARQFVECTIEARHRGRILDRRVFVIALAAHCAKCLIDIAGRFDEALRGPGFS
ncbi:TPA: hypothetical protein SLZ45_000816 [Burkholderia multivorans]|nr:hypothetical protein [Burkholderia multivorans]HEJ2439369.1 hypothetical protein [Burkholderia multivorans]